MLAAHPELKGYLALRLDRKTATKVPEILRGQVAVGMSDTLNRVLDATGVQIAYVLDDLYAADAGKRTYGVTFGGRSPSYRVWAPTAQQVDLLTWAPGAAGRCAGQRRDADPPDPGVGRVVVRLGRRRATRATSTR